MKKLLVPVDFSETSEAAVDFGIQLARRCGYEVHLLHVVDFSGSYEAMYADTSTIQSFTEAVMTDMEIRMENLYRRVKVEGVKITTHLTTGTLVRDVRSFVQETEIDLIVMGTKGAKGQHKFFVGSNAEKIVRMVDCPILTIPSKMTIDGIRKFIVPIDTREIRYSFLKEVSMFQQIFSAKMEFLWVKTPHDLENLELIREEFNNLLDECGIANSSFRIIRDIFPQDGILAYAKQSSGDILAMSTHSRKGLAHLFSGSTTEDVLNQAEIPLWSLKINEAEDIINLESFQKLRVEQ